MKQKILMLLAAVLLGSVSAIAQSGNNEPLKGDVNEDGVVDVADIAAVIEIMKNGGGIGGETFYWYAGQTKPESIDGVPDVDDTNFTNNKWHTFGSTGSTSTTINKTVTGGTAGNYWYIAVPNGFIATTSDLTTPDTSMTQLSNTITVNGSTYVIWRSNTTPAKVTVMMAKSADAQTYYSYVGTDKSEKLVDAATGNLKPDIATQIQTISGVKTYSSMPTSLEAGIEIAAGGDYVYVIAPTLTLNNASTYLVNTSNFNVATVDLGTFTIDGTEYTVRCTPSEVGTVVTAWK